MSSRFHRDQSETLAEELRKQTIARKRKRETAAKKRKILLGKTGINRCRICYR
jgi:hypothetical protein